MTTITIYHNPACGTSRNVLALIRNSGVEPTIIEYLKNPPTTQQIQSWLSAMGATVRQVLREKGTPYAELGLGNEELKRNVSLIAQQREEAAGNLIQSAALVAETISNYNIRLMNLQKSRQQAVDSHDLGELSVKETELLDRISQARRSFLGAG